jgi:predicted TPR repeat methyltransferase
MLDEARGEAALGLAGRAIARSPSNWRLRCARAEVRLAARDGMGAARDAAEAVVLAPDQAAPKAALGSALLALGQTADARACLAEAVGANPGHVGYRLALARGQGALGDLDGARATLDRGIALRPAAVALRIAAARLAVSRRDFATALAVTDAARADGLVDPSLLGLRGHAMSCLDRDEEATDCYREALQLAPEDAYVRHLVAAAGLIAAPGRASPDYVRVLFDGFADHFERDLIRLDYRGPGLIRAALLAHVPGLAASPDAADRDPDPDAAPGPPMGPAVGPGSGHALGPGSGPVVGPVLDLGCGTGLVALVLSDLPVGPFTGIDLSPGMLAEAAAKHLYQNLIEADVDALPAGLGRFALAVAADVLPYLGDPGPLLTAVRDHLADDGLFILTVEALLESDPAPFRLNRRARYAHRPAALLEAAAAAGFAARECLVTPLRRDQDGPVLGCVVVLAPSVARHRA